MSNVSLQDALQPQGKAKIIGRYLNSAGSGAPGSAVSKDPSDRSWDRVATDPEEGSPDPSSSSTRSRASSGHPDPDPSRLAVSTGEDAGEDDARGKLQTPKRQMRRRGRF